MPSFAALSDDELVRYVDQAQREVADLERASRFLNFKPLPFQRPWFASEAPIRAILCGNQLGKSTAGAIEVVSACLGLRPIALGGTHAGGKWPTDTRVGVRVLAAGETFDVGLRDTIVPKLKSFITADMLEGKPKKNAFQVDAGWKFKSGAELILMSYQQAAASFEGAQWDVVWFDEPPPRDVFNAVRRGCMARDGKIFITATPLKEPWLWDDLILPSRDPEHPSHGSVDYFQADMHENCRECFGGYLPHKQIMAYLATLPEHERAAREKGVFLDFQGIEFGYVHDESHVVDDFPLPNSWPLVEVCDPSMKRGTHHIWAVCSPQDFWYIVHAAHVPDGAFSSICEGIKRERAKLPRQPDVAIMDQRGGKHSVSKIELTNWFDEFRKQGLNYIPSVDVPIQTLHEWLRPKWDQDKEGHIPKLRFLRKVTGIDQGPMWALRRFVWDPTASKTRQYRQPSKDFIDCLRYLSGHPGLKYYRMARGLGAMNPQRRVDMAATYGPMRPQGMHGSKFIQDKRWGTGRIQYTTNRYHWKRIDKGYS